MTTTIGIIEPTAVKIAQIAGQKQAEIRPGVSPSQPSSSPEPSDFPFGQLFGYLASWGFLTSLASWFAYGYAQKQWPAHPLVQDRDRDDWLWGGAFLGVVLGGFFAIASIAFN